MEKITLKNIKIYANHGCLEEEEKIGSFYLVNLTVKMNLKKAGNTDNLVDTVNYAELTSLIKEQMAIRSRLLENVAYRILNEIGNKFKEIHEAKVSVSKVNPPVNANAEEVIVTFEKKFY